VTGWIPHQSAAHITASSLTTRSHQVTSQPVRTITLKKIGKFETGTFGQSAVEIIAYDPASKRLFSVNGFRSSVWVLDVSDPARPKKIYEIPTEPNREVNSIAVKNGLVALAVESRVPDDNSPEPRQIRGQVIVYQSSATQFHTPLATITVGFMPDSICFSEDGNTIITANEGEPNTYYTHDPIGSISIIDISGSPEKAVHREAQFNSFEKERLQEAGINIYGRLNSLPADPEKLARMKTREGLRFQLKPKREATVAEDLEPEYVTTRNGKAFVTLQENNGIAIVDLKSAKVTNIIGLGEKDHSRPGNELDASNMDNTINIRNWPVLGRYQPDAIDSYISGGKTYLVTANEGESRQYSIGWIEDEKVKTITFFSEKTRVHRVRLADALAEDKELQKKKQLGRLRISNSLGKNAHGYFVKLYSFGARSFSIWEADNYKRIDRARLVYDSGSDFEQITASRLSTEGFNSSADRVIFDDRSDDKGPEPEALVIGEINGRTYAFIGLERVGGIMIYDITNPANVIFNDYIINRRFDQHQDNRVETCMLRTDDLAPEGIIFIKAEDSPTAKPMIMVGNEVSGNITFYNVVYNLNP